MLAAMLLLGALPGHAMGDDNNILVQSTTSTRNSGLYDFLLPRMQRDTGVTARIVAVGTGQAIRNARNCDADVLLVHAKSAEQAFVDAGYGVARHDLMYNDFVLVGPSGDPAGIASAADIVEALQKIHQREVLFASRGDDSGTHRKELSLWKVSDLNPEPSSGNWYLETGAGMGATLNIGAGKGAYVLTDRATWIAFKNKQDFKILFQGDERLFNQYGVVRVAKSHCPTVKAELADRFVGWLLSEQGQAAIASYELDGQQLFFPNSAAAATSKASQ